MIPIRTIKGLQSDCMRLPANARKNVYQSSYDCQFIRSHRSFYIFIIPAYHPIVLLDQANSNKSGETIVYTLKSKGIFLKHAPL